MGERGSLSIAVTAGVLVMSLTALAGADVGAMLVARARAQAAADAAALAAVVAQLPILGHPDDPEGVARAMAERNGARLLSCRCEPGTTFAEVETGVAPPLTFVHDWGEAHAFARAEADPDVLSYRDDG